MFRKMRSRMKGVIIVVCAAFAMGLLYIGGTSFFGGGDQPMGMPQARAVVATVNGRDIPYEQFQHAYINEIQQIEQQQQGRIDGSLYEYIRYYALNSLVSSVLMNEQLEERRIEASAEDIDERIAEIKAMFDGDEEIFRWQLQMSGITEEELRGHLEHEVRIEKLIEQVAGDVEVSEEELRAAYERVEVSHILLTPTGDDESAWDEAQQQAVEVRALLEDEEFAAVAAEYSHDAGSAQEGGSIGYIGRGDTVPEFEDAAFALAEGTISDPIRSNFGYHILQVTDRVIADGEEFEQEREWLEAHLRSTKSEERAIAWFEQLMDEADVVIHDHSLRAVQEFVNGDYEKAEEYYQLAINENPHDGYLHHSLGRVYQQAGNHEQAIASYQQAVEIAANDASLHVALADAYRQNEQEEEAVAAYLAASEAAPLDIGMQTRVNRALQDLERTEEAAAVEERIAEIQQLTEGLEAQQPTQTAIELEEELLQEVAPADDASEEWDAPVELEIVPEDAGEPQAPEVELE